jgi:hypothetical protein
MIEQTYIPKNIPKKRKKETSINQIINWIGKESTYTNTNIFFRKSIIDFLLKLE